MNCMTIKSVPVMKRVKSVGFELVEDRGDVAL